VKDERTPHLIRSSPTFMRTPHPACPVLTVSVSSRTLGIVCVDAGLRLISVRTHDLRHHRTADAKVRAVRVGLSRAVQELSPARVIIETAAPSPRSQVRDAFVAIVREAAMKAGLPTSMMAFRDACIKVAGVASSAKTTVVLRDWYDSFAGRLPERPQQAFRNQDYFRRIRPVVAALAVAHAALIEDLVANG
jgi:hypothetical protein